MSSQAADLASTTRLLVSSIQLIRNIPNPNSCDWKLLNETIFSLARKHGQLKQAVTKMVQEAMTFLEPGAEGLTDERKMTLVETIRTVTEGKVSNASCLVARWLFSAKRLAGDGNIDARVMRSAKSPRVALCISDGISPVENSSPRAPSVNRASFHDFSTGRTCQCCGRRLRVVELIPSPEYEPNSPYIVCATLEEPMGSSTTLPSCGGFSMRPPVHVSRVPL